MYILLLFKFCTFLSYSSTVHSAPFNYFTVLSATIQLLYCTFRHSPQLINYLTFFLIQLLYFFATIQLYRLLPTQCNTLPTESKLCKILLTESIIMPTESNTLPTFLNINLCSAHRNQHNANRSNILPTFNYFI